LLFARLDLTSQDLTYHLTCAPELLRVFGVLNHSVGPKRMMYQGTL
jgi:hypothetical protein